MIVIYSWLTRKKSGVHRRTETIWKGAFLFGLIPLFIWVRSKQWIE
jgi:hypothetical protein